ncbi:MAG: AsmA-like C-terminal region-containing protein, partial [Rickettsiaceae bacterium]|nr:AsmA-like C-terminal region-containing protein [Rickettsiaceae bacterium]
FTIHNAFMGVDFLTAPSMLKLRRKILDTLDLSKVDIAMSFSIKKLYQDAFSLNRVLFQARNNKNLLDIKKFDTDLLGGRMQSSGSILLDPYTLNFVYALNSVHIEEVAKLLPQGMLESGGVLSASGMWSTRGDKLDEQLYNLYTRSNVVTKDIVLQNFSIDNLIQEMGVANYNVLSLKEDIKKAMLTQSTQISDLKTNVELSKGVFTLSALAFKTKYSAASGSALFNLYDFNVDSSTIFSFYLAKPKYGRSTTDYAPAKMTVTANGNLLSPKKTADTKELEEILKARNQQ